MALLAFSISFVAAFLLFSSQPMITKMVLPELGGAPAVWNTAVFTFQFLLLLGYGYAHALSRLPSLKVQWAIHAVVVVAAFFLLPLTVSIAGDPSIFDRPISTLLFALMLQVGLPFFCLAATAPLLQSWVVHSHHPLAAQPYRLYSASNLGSFCGLLGYVFVIEPVLVVSAQSIAWTGLFIAVMAALLLLGWRVRQAPRALATAQVHEALPVKNYVWWVILAFVPSSLSLGVTTYITTDIAAIPLLWVLPLAIYLLSYVDAFSARPRFVATAQRIAVTSGAVAIAAFFMLHTFAIVFHLFAVGVLCFAIHGALSERKPASAFLTHYYVCLSFGGMLGGLLNGMVAPVLFNAAFEYPLMVWLACMLAFYMHSCRHGLAESIKSSSHWLAATLMLAIVTPVFAVLTYKNYVKGSSKAISVQAVAERMDTEGLIIVGAIGVVIVLLHVFDRMRLYMALAAMLSLVMLGGDIHSNNTTLSQTRNFFGVLKVYKNAANKTHLFSHGTTQHGLQSLDPEYALKPVSYYAPLKEIFYTIPAARKFPFAVLGLGVGTVKCFGNKASHVDFFEIDEMVKTIAEDSRYFTYLRDCPGTHAIVIGDGRVEIAKQPAEKYGLIVLDAYSSDSLPVHLITTQAIQIYMDKLVSGGILAFNVSNRHMDLRPLLGATARALGWVAYTKSFSSNTTLEYPSVWVVLAKKPQDLAPVFAKHKGWKAVGETSHRPWSDDFSNVIQYLHMFQ